MEKPLKIRLHVISPVHIGCDEEYEPTSFVVDGKKRKLVTFDPLDFIKSLSEQERDKFTSICMEGTLSSIIKMYKFLSNKKVSGREVDISDEFIRHFNKVKDLPAHDEKKIGNNLNQFYIGRTAYNANTGMPYIPGTSLKGALRTAYLSYHAKERKLERYWNKYLSHGELKTDKDKYFFIGKKS